VDGAPEPAAPGAAEPPDVGALGRLTRAIAIAGGLLCVGIAALVTVSVVLRGANLGSVRGDFELVQMGTALAVFAFLPWCQARRGNVVVDTFTTRLPQRAVAALDALWDLGLAGMMAVIAWRLGLGALDAFASRTTTMVLLVPVGPAIAACAALAGLLALVSVATAVARLRTPA
jgi:TRAP-type C4-dicarboxylate transport system permease small subunit